ncbi:Uncharacterized protein M6B38_235755 [Iris pallida]|uniref:DCD domain-containing protein n=1 Tax=Iris pallida TaxID=29817 RepID=A0AAX6DNK3_IRIPA|nr:Uncharacterized protein M6B38_235755 [Iris pallida]
MQMISMEYEDGNKKQEQCSMMKGAIFMSNRKTKQECIKRKLFGLPSTRTWFIMKIKAGMLLFLFENEERKLYGVFEATSDGALNIVPNAFISSGNSFPAQVLFRRIWMCQPLFEHEFRDAIKENYYTHNKFNFGLSYEQVFKLVHLFSSRRIGVDLHLRRGIPNDLITEFEMSGRVKGRVTVEGRYLESNAKEDNTDVVDLERYTDLSRENTNYPYFEKHFTTSQASLASTECESYKMSPLAIKPRPPISMHPTFPDCPSNRGNFSCPSHGRVDHQYFPCSDDKIPSVKFGVIDDPSLSREPNTWITSPMENIIPHSRSQIRPWQTGPSYSSNYRSSSFQISKIPNVSLPTVGFRDHPNLQDCKELIYPEQYDPKNSRIPFSMQADSTAKGMNSLVSMCYPKSADVLPSAQPLFDLREQQFQGLGSCDYIPLSDDNDKNMQLCDLDRPYCSYYSESEGGDEGTDELPPYTQKVFDKYYPTDTDSRFHSDADHSRSSVFSRLSKSSEAPPKHSPRHRDPRVSLNQHRNMSWRREDILKANCHSTICDNHQEQAGSIVMKDPSEVANVSDQLELSRDAVFGEMSEVPFMNFKRRSEIQRRKRETVTGLYVVSGNEESLGKNKRRKLVRPSLNEECENLIGTSREHTELGERNIEGDIKNKNITSPEPSLRPKTESVEPAEESTGEDVAEKGENQNNTSPIPAAYAETENVTDSSMNYDKEISKIVSVDPAEKGENQNISVISPPIPSASPETENDINSMNHVKEISKTVSVESAEKIARGGVTGEDKSENNPSPEPCPSAGTGNVADSSKNHVKEICNKNLRWFLERRM